MKFFYSFLLAITASLVSYCQTSGDYRSTGTVVLNTATNWETYDGSSWSAATVPPSGNIASGNTVTIQPAHTWNGNSTVVNIPAGATLIFQGVTGGTFTANTLTISGTYIHFTTAASGTVLQAINAATGMATGSTFIYRGSSSFTPSPTFGGRTYYNLTYDTDGTGTPTISGPAPGSQWTVNGQLTVNNWKLDLYHATNTFGLLNGDILVTGTTAVLRLKNTTIATGKTLTIDPGDSLAIGNSYSLTVNGSLVNKTEKAINFGTGATLVVNGLFRHEANGGSIPSNAANVTYNTGATIQVTGITNAPNIAILPANCPNVIWNCPLQTTFNTFVNIANGGSNISGDFTIQSTGTAMIYISGANVARTLNVTGNFIMNGGKFSVIKPTGATTTADQVCTVAGDVIVNGGQLYIADSTAINYTGKGYLNIGGSLYHTGGVLGANVPSIAGSGIMRFVGNNTNKSIHSTGLSGNVSVVIEKTAMGLITIDSDLSLPAAAGLRLTSGRLAIAAGRLLTVNSPTSITSASDTGYIVSNVNGSNLGLLKINNVNSATLFPVGTATNYLPAVLTPATTSSFTAGVFQGATTNALPNGTPLPAAKKALSVDAVWRIARTSANTDNVGVNLHWTNNLEGAQFAALGNNIGLATFNSNWSPSSGSGNNTADTAADQLSSFAAFSVAQLGLVLPLRFSSVAATLQNTAIQVQWGVENENNLQQYGVERSADGVHFITIASQPVQANGTKANTYTYKDEQPEPKNFYRIKAIDVAGSVNYSAIAYAANDKTVLTTHLFSPNPVKNRVINLDNKLQNAQLKLVNMMGQTVWAATATTNAIALPQDLAPGTYMLTAATNEMQPLQQIMILQ